jgi:thiamine-phosphate pyrophosphorylase
MAERCLLYYITDRSAFGTDEHTRQTRLLAKIAEATRAGVDFIQLREKDLPVRDLESLAREAMSVIAKLKAENPELRTSLLINSRTDVAMAVQAAGVHLRSDDISPNDVGAIWGKIPVGAAALGCPAAQSSAPTESDGKKISSQAPIVGVSCHAPEEVRHAEQNGAAFAVFAPVFEKKNAPAAGLTLLHEACQARIPVLALGGITLDNAHSCLAAGAAGVAAIRLFQENDIAEIMERLRQKL